MKKYCTRCGKPFEAVGREVICSSCKEEAAAAAKRAAVERAKMRSYTGEACPVRISAKARGFIEAVAERKGMKFIPALDAILRPACKMYGFENWDDVPEHKTARRTSKAAKVAETVTPAAPVKASASKATSKAEEAPQEAPQTAKAAKTTAKTSTAKKAVKPAAGKKGEKVC